MFYFNALTSAKNDCRHETAKQMEAETAFSSNHSSITEHGKVVQEHTRSLFRLFFLNRPLTMKNNLHNRSTGRSLENRQQCFSLNPCTQKMVQIRQHKHVPAIRRGVLCRLYFTANDSTLRVILQTF